MIREMVEAALERRCFVSKDDFRPLPTIDDRDAWSRLDGEAVKYYSDMTPELLTCAPAPIPASLLARFYLDGDRRAHAAAYFGRRVQLYKLCLCELIENQGRFVANIIDHIWAICEETSWVIPAHMHQNPFRYGILSALPSPALANSYIDLFCAETASLLCWVKYLLGSRLNVYPAVNERIDSEIRQRILNNYENVPLMKWSGCVKGAHLNNWTPWICSNLIAVALLSEDDADRRSGWLRLLAGALDAFLDTYAPDGGCDEGPGYYNRAGASLLDALELYFIASNGQASVWHEPLIQNIASYIVYAHIDGEYYINFADASCRVKPDAALLRRCAGFMDAPELKEHAEYLLSARLAAPPYQANYDGIYRRLRNTLDYRCPIAAPTRHRRPLSHYFSGIEVAFARESERAGGLYMAVKGGHNEESHNHNDIGNYIVYASGEPFIVDAGVETYSRKTFFSDRYEIWTMQSGYHNTAILDGRDQRAGKEYAARGAEFEDFGEAATFCCDIAPAYGLEGANGNGSYLRTLTLDRQRKEIHLTDEVAMPREMSVILPLLTAQKPELSPGKALLKGKNTALQIDFDPDYRAEVEEIPLLDPQIRGNWQRDSLYRLLIKPDKKYTSGKLELKFTETKQ